MQRAFPYLVALFLLSPPLAASAAQVESLQLPAWMTRAEQRQPLRPGMALTEADTVETGPGARLLIRLADGGFIKLGENTRLAFASLQEETAPGGSIKGLLNVARGAIRYTTGPLTPSPRHAIDVQLATTTVGIRGTDVWARNQDGAVVLCLIEGQVSVHHPAGGERTLDEPLTFFLAPREGEPHPVAPVDPDQFKQWVAETELVPGQGVLLPGGGWSVQFGSYGDEASAHQAEQQLLARGLPVERTTVQLKERTFYRLRVSGFDTQQDAKASADRNSGPAGSPKPWVTCNAPGSGCR